MYGITIVRHIFRNVMLGTDAVREYVVMKNRRSIDFMLVIVSLTDSRLISLVSGAESSRGASRSPLLPDMPALGVVMIFSILLLTGSLCISAVFLRSFASFSAARLVLNEGHDGGMGVVSR